MVNYDTHKVALYYVWVVPNGDSIGEASSFIRLCEVKYLSGMQRMPH